MPSPKSKPIPKDPIESIHFPTLGTWHERLLEALGIEAGSADSDTLLAVLVRMSHADRRDLVTVVERSPL